MEATRKGGPPAEYSDQGRWASPDPAGRSAVSLATPQTWNRYAYVTNNPLALTDPLGLTGNCKRANAGPSSCYTQPPWGGDGSGDLFGDGTSVDGIDAYGYSVFDAIVGAPGTYISYNMYGQMSFGFSEDLYFETQNFLDQNQYMRGNPGLEVVLQDLGEQQVVSGFVPEYYALQQQRSQVLGAMPDRFKQDMLVTSDDLVAAGMGQGAALSTAIGLEIQKMQNFFASEPDARGWLNTWGGLVQDTANLFGRWGSLFPQRVHSRPSL